MLQDTSTLRNYSSPRYTKLPPRNTSPELSTSPHKWESWVVQHLVLGLIFQPSRILQREERYRPTYCMAKANWSVDPGVRVSVQTHPTIMAQGNVVYAQEFARRHGDKIISVSVHPGLTSILDCDLQALADLSVR